MDLDDREDVLPDILETTEAKTNRLHGLLTKSGVGVSRSFKTSMVKDLDIDSCRTLFCTRILVSDCCLTLTNSDLVPSVVDLNTECGVLPGSEAS